MQASGYRCSPSRTKDRGDGKTDIWVKAGSAWVNRDGSLNVYLDVLPLDGKLHVREALERRDGAGNATEHTAVMEAH